MEQRAPRYPFDAPAEIIVEGSGTKILARVTELSLHGCYLDTSTPLTGHTAVFVKIFGPDDYFEAHSTVIYAHSLLGVGVAFRDVNVACQRILRKWLLGAMLAKESG
jgi:hypothetical protein